MARYISTEDGLLKLSLRLCKWGYEHQGKPEYNHEEFDYWHKCVVGCMEEGLAMDEVDYENAPQWFRELWKGLK